ncbi:hypothetical protein D3C72_1983250 [compost metagenome]
MAACLLQIDHEAVIQLTRIARRRAGIKNVPGNDDRIHLLRLRRLQQPVQERFMFGGATFAVKILPQMPVRGVEYAHNSSMAKKGEGDYKLSGAGK